MRQAIVYQCVYTVGPLGHMLVYARKRTKTVLDGEAVKLLILYVLTPVNTATVHLYMQHPVWG